MAFRVFISHSTADMGLVYQLKYWPEANGIEAYVAQLYPQPGTPLADKVINEIRACDCFLALLTRDGARSEWVREEIGAAVSAKHTTGRPAAVVPILEEGVQLKGLLADKEYVSFNRANPVDTINLTVQFVYGLKLNKDAHERTTAIAVGLVGLLALAVVSSRREEDDWEQI